MRIAVCVILAFVVVVVVALAGEDQANPKPQGMTLRLELFVSDLQTSIDFYTNVLGFERLNGEARLRASSVWLGAPLSLATGSRSPQEAPFQSRSSEQSPWTRRRDRSGSGRREVFLRESQSLWIQRIPVASAEAAVGSDGLPSCRP